MLKFLMLFNQFVKVREGESCSFNRVEMQYSLSLFYNRTQIYKPASMRKTKKVIQSQGI